MIPDELIGRHGVAGVLPLHCAAPTVGVDPRAKVMGGAVELVEIVRKRQRFIFVHDRLKDQPRPRSHAPVLAARGRPGAHHRASHMCAMIIGVAPVREPPDIQHADQPPGKIGMQRIADTRIQTGIGDGDHLARAVEAVGVAHAIDVQAVALARHVVEHLRRLVDFDPLYFRQAGEVGGGLRRQRRAHQAPALPRRRTDVGRSRDLQLAHQVCHIVRCEGLQGDRYGQGRVLTGEGRQQRLDFVQRPVFIQPNHVRQLSQVV